jgi:RNA polymerase sigma-70 factor (ECF subfamily)
MPNVPEDAGLAAAVRAGDAGAFEALIRSHGPRLVALARRILGNDDEAREAVHEAFIAAYRARDQFNGQSLVSTWLHRIATNSALMKLRSRRRRSEDSIDDLLPHFLPDGHHREHFQSWAEPVDTILARQETAATVRRAIEALPDTFRTVLLLRDIEGLSTEEAALMLGISANAVKLRLHRARMALRTVLAPHFQGGAA